MRPLDKIEIVGGHPAVDFVNTVHSWRADPPPDYLSGFDDFANWNRIRGLLQPKMAARFKKRAGNEKAEAFAEAVELRANLHRLFVAITEGKPLPHKALDRLNEIMHQTASWRRLAGNRTASGTVIRSVWEFAEAPALAALGPVAWAAADLLENGGLDRLKECPGPRCGWVFIDASKNRSRTWCSMKTCGNTAKVKRFRKRAEAGRDKGSER
ncbi:MAG TPA: ABATE domain-containing protein [Woeseiaceae bacterium]|nr:ABATE domain-containing protein [Woeseiaceae bacterium]